MGYFYSKVEKKKKKKKKKKNGVYIILRIFRTPQQLNKFYFLFFFIYLFVYKAVLVCCVKSSSFSLYCILYNEETIAHHENITK